MEKKKKVPERCVHLEEVFGWSGTDDAFIARIPSWYPTGQSLTRLSLVDIKIGQLPDRPNLFFTSNIEEFV